MIMAAGLGTRMKPFSNVRAKPFLPLMGVPVVQFVLDLLTAHGVKNSVINVHSHYQDSLAEIKNLDLGKIVIKTSDESEQLLGGAGGIQKALPLLNADKFFVLNGDLICHVDLEKLAMRHAQLKTTLGVNVTLALCAKNVHGEKYREIQFGSNGLVTGFGNYSNSSPFYVGIAVLERSALDLVPSSGPSDFVNDILRPQIERKKVGAFLVDSDFYDVGSPRNWLNAHVDLIRGLESGRGIAKYLRKRIELKSCRVGEHVWISKRDVFHANTRQWVGPAYWNTWGDESAHCPNFLGPNAVVYGGGINESLPSIQNSIHFGGAGVEVGPSSD
jgi:N-acetyl-alpha-D-muramate 1-phosphate uridylyltransferase